MPEPKIVTFGCRLNTYESEVMRAHACAAGLEHAIIFNTCAVTTEAERQARQAIRKARRENPEAFIIVTGCGAQINPHVFAQMPEVDRILGNTEKMSVENFDPHLSERLLVNDIMAVKETALHLITGFEARARAFIQVQNGCNHRCTFCTIPYGRGNSRSVPMGEIVTQLRLLVEKGIQEVVLTGVDITAYGEDLPNQPRVSQMIQRILKQVPDLPRLRLSSLDPVEMGEDFFELVACEPRLMPHFHLSLQAGDDMILKRMKRRHLRHHAVDFCERVKSIRPDVVFGADLIAGFPTETEEMFQNTLSLIEVCSLSYLHIFPYSPRPGTPAARMPQVTPSRVKARAAALRQEGEKALLKSLTSFLGKQATVLMEKEYFGHTEHFAPVVLGSPHKVGSLVPVQLMDLEKNQIVGLPLVQKGQS